MSTNTIFEGQKIEIQLAKQTSMNEKVAKTYTCRISEITDEEIIEVTIPSENRKLIILEKEVVYNLFFYTKKGILQARGSIVSNYKSSSLYLMKIKILTTLIKYQRREFYRYNCTMKFESVKLDYNEYQRKNQKNSESSFAEILQNSDQIMTGITTDISGGGIKIIMDQYYENGDFCVGKFSIKSGNQAKEIIIIGKILTSQKLENEKNRCTHSIQYEYINKVEREEVIRYIFDEERKYRKQNNDR